jgi:hypothetical protein
MFGQTHKEWPPSRPGWWPRVQTHAGEVLVAGRTAVTPIAKTLTIGSVAGGFVFRRSWPSTLSVVEDGGRSRMRIVDMTRLIQLAIVLAAVLPVMGGGTRRRPGGCALRPRRRR